MFSIECVLYRMCSLQNVFSLSPAFHPSLIWCVCVCVCVCVCACVRACAFVCTCMHLSVSPVLFSLFFYCLHLQTHTHHFRWLFAPSLSMRAALQQQSRLALVYSHLKLPPQRKPTSPTSAVFSKSETTCIFHFDSQRVAEMFQY